MSQAPKKQNKAGDSHWMRYTGIASEMLVIIFVAAFAGNRIDQKLGWPTPWMTIVFLFFGMSAAFYLVYKQLK